MKKIFKIIAALLLLAVLAVGGLYFFQEKIIFLSETLPQDYTFNYEAPFEEITLDGAEGATLHGLRFTVEKPRGIVLYFHGNAGNLSKWGAIASQFTNADYEVLMMDYRGYGKSEGPRSEENLYADAEVFYDQAKEWYPQAKIIVFGRSLGTTFATYVASKNKPRKLVLESPFYSLERLAKERYPYLPVNSLLRYQFNTAQYIQSVDCLITIIHGTEDSVVPISSSELLYQIIPERKRNFVRIKNGKHNNLNTFQEYWLAIRKELAY
ncbi:MAG: alpha/beta hydrolase [Flavobacteriaceae bacterium]|nr:alpha/beta hydrolase [Flavobacteriaceae bacterium]|tara:strand:- start:691 stop:1491 length:801 start_codon:yes stop_codon:yes gene_type:complete